MPTPRAPGRVLLVDDDPGLLRLLTIRLKSEGYEVAACESAAQAQHSVPRFNPDVVVSDLRMAQVDGIGLLKELQRRYPALPVIIMTAHGTIPDAVEATRSGAFAFLTKPIERDQLLEQIGRAVQVSGSSRATDEWREGLVTRNPGMEECLAQALRVAGTDAPVLLTGPRGTGKAALARALHKASPRREGPFTRVDCVALTAEQASQLAADGGGTLYLDGIEDLSPALQATLAQSLASTDAARGARQPRVVASASRDLAPLVASGQFRDDLFYRLNAVQIPLPPLAQRREDIPLLAAAQLDKLAARSGRRLVLAPEATELLVTADWPGNIPQLFGLLGQIHATGTGAVISAETVQRALGSPEARVTALDEARDEFTRSYLVQLLQLTKGNVSQAARLARRNRTDFYKLLSKHEVRPEEFKAS